MKKLNILVFPCGSEIGLEIHSSLKHFTHFGLFGANSINDHGSFVFENYIGNVPFIKESNFISAIKEIVKANNIDAIFPAMDSVIVELKNNEIDIGCKVISSELETTKICLSKSRTYQALAGFVNVPLVYKSIKEISDYPVFLKPDIGYGSRGVFKADTKADTCLSLPIAPCMTEAFVCEEANAIKNFFLI